MFYSSTDFLGFSVEKTPLFWESPQGAGSVPHYEHVSGQTQAYTRDIKQTTSHLGGFSAQKPCQPLLPS